VNLAGSFSMAAKTNNVLGYVGPHPFGLESAKFFVIA
jgi:hypothetical protein